MSCGHVFKWKKIKGPKAHQQGDQLSGCICLPYSESEFVPVG